MITDATDSEIVILSVHTVRDPDRKRPILKVERRMEPPKPDSVVWDKGTFLVVKETIHPGIFWAVCVGIEERVEVVLNPVNYTFLTRSKFSIAKRICRSGSKHGIKEGRQKEPLAVASTTLDTDSDGREAGTSPRSLTRIPRMVSLVQVGNDDERPPFTD